MQARDREEISVGIFRSSSTHIRVVFFCAEEGLCQGIISARASEFPLEYE